MTDTTKIKGLPVEGYRAQQPEAIAMVNINKRTEERILRQIDQMVEINEGQGGQSFDGRWLAIARTHIEEGFMALNRAVFKPGRAKLPEDEGLPPL